MSLIGKIKEKLGGCDHQWIIRYDERNDLDDDLNHTFKITICEKCGKIKKMEQLQ